MNTLDVTTTNSDPLPLNKFNTCVSSFLKAEAAITNNEEYKTAKAALRTLTGRVKEDTLKKFFSQNPVTLDKVQRTLNEWAWRNEVDPTMVLSCERMKEILENFQTAFLSTTEDPAYIEARRAKKSLKNEVFSLLSEGISLDALKNAVPEETIKNKIAYWKTKLDNPRPESLAAHYASKKTKFTGD